MIGSELIAEERQRQIDAEGWTPEHDDEHENGELVSAAIAYALYTRVGRNGWVKMFWPWTDEWWKPSPLTSDPRTLVKAGALIAAELDRLQRIGKRKEASDE